MSSPLPPWPNVFDVLAELLADLAPQEVVSVTPDDLEEHLPLCRVVRIGGNDDRITDVARVDVEVYAGTWTQAWDLAEDARQIVLVRRQRTAAGLLDRAETEVAPRRLSHPNPRVRLVGAVYRVYTRRWSTAP